MFSYFQFDCGFFGIYQGVLVPNFLCPLESYGEEKGHEVHTIIAALQQEGFRGLLRKHHGNAWFRFFRNFDLLKIT